MLPWGDGGAAECREQRRQDDNEQPVKRLHHRQGRCCGGREHEKVFESALHMPPGERLLATIRGTLHAHDLVFEQANSAERMLVACT